MEFGRQVIINTPIWVWPLLVVLILLGIRASRDRVQPIWPYWFMPLLGVMAVRNAFVSPDPLFVTPVFVICYLAGVYLGYRNQKRWLVEKSGSRVRLKGEWITLSCIMVIFISNYVHGITSAVAPTLLQPGLFLALFIGAIALVSGVFLGRSIRIFFHPATNVKSVPDTVL